MNEVRRGTVVGDAAGKLFVAWGRCGDLANLMPVLTDGRVKPCDHVVRVRVAMHHGAVRVLAVDAEARRHVSTALLLPLGTVSAEGLTKLVSDVAAQKREAERRDSRQAVHDTVARASRRAKARARRDMAWVRLADCIVDACWPAEQVAA